MTQKAMVLEMLREGEKTTGDFIRRAPLGAEYRRAMSELRRDGHIIESRCRRKGEWVYRLMEPTDFVAPV